jgi:hypothetical protein
VHGGEALVGVLLEGPQQRGAEGGGDAGGAERSLVGGVREHRGDGGEEVVAN